SPAKGFGASISCDSDTATEFRGRRTEAQTAHAGELLHRPEADVVTVEPVLGRTRLTAANHRVAGVELAMCDQPHGAAARAGHHGHIRVLGVAEFGLVFKYENCRSEERRV